VAYLNKNKRTLVVGTSAEYESIRSSRPTMGRFFTKNEEARRATVALLGRTVIKELFGNKNPIGKNIKIDKINFRVIGVLPEKGVAGPRDQDDVIIVPYTTAMKKMYGKTYIDSIDVELVKDADTKSAEESIKEFLFSRHNVALSQRDNAFRIMNMAEMQKMMSEMGSVMSMLLASIAGISLLVGGIGIMNIMLVSVTERTKEIGIRKAIGAKKRDILLQFLTESFVLSIIGGLLGVVLGVGASVMLSYFAGWTTVVSISSIILALGFSLCIGLFFGVYPALKAAKLKPIIALRYE
jgi:macrolide transport system ATP-binding/permease protein